MVQYKCSGICTMQTFWRASIGEVRSLQHGRLIGASWYICLCARVCMYLDIVSYVYALCVRVDAYGCVAACVALIELCCFSHMYYM